MSGQPYKTQMDIAKTRQQYLANLQLRAELDDRNLQANKVYIKTGQLPVEPSDTRTLTEKLADVERLKIDLRGKLLDLTDGQNANRIVDSLNNEQLLFLSQNFAPIKEQIKRSYALGVQSDIFVDFLRRYMEKFNLTRGVEMGLQQSTGRELLANQRLILSQMASKRDITEIQDMVSSLGIQNSNLGKAIMSNLKELQDIIEYLPETFASLSEAENVGQKERIIKLLNNIVDELPTKRDLGQLSLQLEQMRSARDSNGLSIVLQRLQELTSTGTDMAEEIALLKAVIKESGGRQGLIEAKAEPVTQIATADVSKFSPEQISIQKKYKSIDDASMKSTKALKDYIDTRYPLIQDKMGNVKKNEFIKGVLNDDSKTFSTLSMSDAKLVAQTLNGLLREEGWGESNPVGVGRGMKGMGLSKHVNLSGNLVSKPLGIQCTDKFAQMGRYKINCKQLNKDIVAIKRNCGSSIASMPSTRVSRNMGSIIRKVIGGGVPTFEEIESLSDEERVYLHKVAKETHIEDKLSIPTPKKDEDEKDINQFEILKGQILAGNDNLEVVKKFKTILLKLSRKDLIPKSQVKDLLLDLVHLGY